MVAAFEVGSKVPSLADNTFGVDEALTGLTTWRLTHHAGDLPREILYRFRGTQRGRKNRTHKECLERESERVPELASRRVIHHRRVLYGLADRELNSVSHGSSMLERCTP